MPYVGSDGQLVQTRPFGISSIVEYFWGAINFFSLFFRGLLHMDDSGPQRGQYGNRQRIPGGRRTIGGFRPSGGAAPPPCVGGG
ncbi:selenoprotein K [Folsomia candida]|uniref:selenoprotein K n=1 Tax=Folsomia candida TaxID=158441 RepID=UPI000B8F8084|nr:selenoprotein K [Folsomia candida]